MSETSQAWLPLVDYRRNGIAEVVVYGAVSWVVNGNVIHQVGGDNLIYGRSLTKPYQMKGIASDLRRFLSLEAKALSVASHGSEDFHIHTLKQMLEPSKLRALLTPKSMPLSPLVKVDSPSAFYHPCSGKHAAILKVCELRGWPTENYTSPDHPYHKTYVEELRKVLGESWKPEAIAKDGCGLPTFSTTVTELAKLYANLAVTRDDDWIWEAMTTFPELVGGTGRLDSTIMKFSGARVVAKEGADGLLGLAILHDAFPDGLGVVIKIAHGGDAKVMWFIASALLRTLGFHLSNPAPLDRQTAFVSPLVVPEILREKFTTLMRADTSKLVDDQFS